MPVSSFCAQVMFSYFLPEAAGSAKGLYFLHLFMDLSEILGKTLKMNSYLMSCLKSGKEEEQNWLEYGRTHHEVQHDRFDESRNFDLKLNVPAR